MTSGNGNLQEWCYCGTHSYRRPDELRNVPEHPVFGTGARLSSLTVWGVVGGRLRTQRRHEVILFWLCI